MLIFSTCIFSQCKLRCLERHGRLWVHDGHTPEMLGVTCAGLKHAHDTHAIYAGFPKPPQLDGENDVDYAARLAVLVNPIFPGCFHPGFVAFSGGVCTSLRSKYVPGRYLRVSHGKGTGGASVFKKGLRQMECASLCLLLATPVDTFFNGYSPIDVTTIR